MRIILPKIILLGIALACSQANGQDRIDPVWMEKLKVEGKASYEKYMSTFDNIDEVSEVHCEYFESPSQTVGTPIRKRVDSWRRVRLGKNSLIQRRIADEGRNIREKIECENTVYRFTLSKSPENEKLTLTGYELVDKTELPTLSGGVYDHAVDGLQQVFDAIAGRESYKLLAVHMDPEKGLLHIKSTFRIDDDTVKQEVWVDPQHDWRVVESIVETRSGRFTTQVQYGNSTMNGLVMPSGFTNVSTYKVSGVNAMKITGKVESVGPCEMSEEDFRLSAFGFEEPVDAAPFPADSTPIYVWLLVTAAVLAPLTGLFYYLRSRRS